jgi:hypothetical protein
MPRLVIEYPAILFSSETARSPLVDVVYEEEDFRTQYLHRYRSGAFRSFLLVDQRGNRIMVDTQGVKGLALGTNFRFGVVPGVLTAILTPLVLDPPVALCQTMTPDGSETLEETKERLYHYLRNYPKHFHVDPATLRGRVARAKDMKKLALRLTED